MKISKVVDEMRKSNPYPEYLFKPLKFSLWNIVFHRDSVFGSFGRLVWNNCIDEFCKIYLSKLDD